LTKEQEKKFVVMNHPPNSLTYQGEEFHKAWLNFLRVVGEEFYIYKLLDWLTIKLENGAKRWKIVRMIIK